MPKSCSADKRDYNKNQTPTVSRAMNEQRLQAYRNLIQQLLACANNGEVNQILNPG